MLDDAQLAPAAPPVRRRTKQTRWRRRAGCIVGRTMTIVGQTLSGITSWNGSAERCSATAQPRPSGADPAHRPPGFRRGGHDPVAVVPWRRIDHAETQRLSKLVNSLMSRSRSHRSRRAGRSSRLKGSARHPRAPPQRSGPAVDGIERCARGQAQRANLLRTSFCRCSRTSSPLSASRPGDTCSPAAGARTDAPAGT